MNDECRRTSACEHGVSALTASLLSQDANAQGLRELSSVHSKIALDTPRKKNRPMAASFIVEGLPRGQQLYV